MRKPAGRQNGRAPGPVSTGATRREDRRERPGPARPPAWRAPDPPPPALRPTQEFLDTCAAAGIEFEGDDLERLGRFLALLLDANTSINLTGIKAPAEAWLRHIFDALTLMPVLADLPEGARVLDVGSGGGVPGVPLAVVMPRARFVLLEATGKKAAYLREVVRALGLVNVSVAEARAEALGHDRGEKAPGGRTGGHREAYDAVIARAVGPMATVAELTVPFCRIGGVIALVKGQKAGDELIEGAEALRRLNAVHAATIETPTGRLVVLSKSSATPRDYPRRDGEPKRSPLGMPRRGKTQDPEGDEAA